jgi:RNA polymerase subunit RPABC4/transcription elongation factor Spt4
MPTELKAPCHACGAPMDETASHCPQCRSPRPGTEADGKSGAGLWILIVIVVGGLVATALKLMGLFD